MEQKFNFKYYLMKFQLKNFIYYLQIDNKYAPNLKIPWNYIS